MWALPFAALAVTILAARKILAARRLLDWLLEPPELEGDEEDESEPEEFRFTDDQVSTLAQAAVWVRLMGTCQVEDCKVCQTVVAEHPPA